jgi:anaerobic dimethyl sulfoxide reductase subunit A
MSDQNTLTQALTNTLISRRTFLKWSAVLGGTVALSGGVGVGLKKVEPVAAASQGKWVAGCCWPDCGSKGLNKVYVVDGVIVRAKTDDTIQDSPDTPQLRGCVRGRSQRKHLLGADRLKYPMKRKNFAPNGGGKKELRGKDEWVRISWDEALDTIAGEIKRIKEKYGNTAILANHTRVPISRMLSLYGGFVDDWGSQSGGCWPATSLFGFPGEQSDRMELRNAQLIVMWARNPAWSRAGNASYAYLQDKKAGTKFIFIDPFYNPSAQVLADEWVPIRPATDSALMLGMIHTLITQDDPKANPLIDWDFLNRCTVGFDKDHMPKGADPKDNLKDYVLGTYDQQPKTPEWAADICGVPPEKIRSLAKEIAQTKNVAITMSPAPTRATKMESLPQMVMAFGAMTGHIGRPGSVTSCDNGHENSAGGGALIQGGTGYSKKTFLRSPIIKNPLAGDREAGVSYYTQVAGPNVVAFGNNDVWDAVLDGKFTAGKGDVRPVDIHMIYHAFGAKMNQLPGTMRAIEAHRKVDFVVTQNMFLTTDAKYSDIVLPVISNWEKWGDLTPGYREQLLWTSQVMEPYFESKDDYWISQEIGKRLGLDPLAIAPWSWKQEIVNEVADTKVFKEDGKTLEPLVTITEADLKEFEVEGKPQQGRIPIKEFKEKGIYHVQRKPGDNFVTVPLKAFRDDPEKNPLKTASGKLEIHSQAYADYVNGCGWTEIKPYPTYGVPIEGYETTFSDWKNKVKGEYPLQLQSIHQLRRAHSTFENTPWLREAFRHDLSINPIDAEQRGLKDGDWVLIKSRWGKVIRPIWVTNLIIPGVVALGQGAWAEIDEATGIDKAGCINVLQGALKGGISQTSCNGTNIQVEKWTGEVPEPDYKWPQRVPLKE